MLPTGELLVFSVTSADAHSTYRCRTVHHVTGDTVESSSYARLVVTGKFLHKIRYVHARLLVNVEKSRSFLIWRVLRKALRNAATSHQSVINMKFDILHL